MMADSEKQTLYILGAGVVSPAGLGGDALLAAVRGGVRLPPGELSRARGEETVVSPVRAVPKEALAGLPRHPRIRRSSPITKFALVAGLAALEDSGVGSDGIDPERTGLIFSFMNGCVSYTNRFYGEVLANPELASPLLFPETVFNAPESHLGAFLGLRGPAYTIVGDGCGLYSGLEVADLWIASGTVDRCLLVAAEELDWLSVEALGLYGRGLLAAEGAAAFLLGRDGDGVRLEEISGPHPFLSLSERGAAFGAARDGLGPRGDSATCLVDGARGLPRLDRAEADVWADWEGDRLSPYRVLGDGMGVGAGFQLAAGWTWAREQRGERVLVSSPGSNQNTAAVALHCPNHP